MKIRAWWLIAALFLVPGAAALAADPYPTKPVRVIVPVPAGGGVDTIARIVSSHLREELGQTFVVENKPGAGGNIGLGELAKSAPDGYTLAVVPNTLTINQTLLPNLPFDAIKSFTPVIELGASSVIMSVRGNLPAKTLAELVAYAKANPGKLTYAACDTGSIQHLAGEMFKTLAGVDITHVPYKGCSDSIPNVLGGQVDMLFITYTNIAAYLKDGRLRAFAVSDEQRLPYAPDIPTGIEQGLAGYLVAAWYGMLAPAGTPPDIVDKLNQAMNNVLKRDDVRASMAAVYITPVGGAPSLFANRIRTDIDRYGKVVKQADIHLEQ